MKKKESTYRGYTQAQHRASQKYLKEHLDEIKIRVPKGRKAYYRDAAVAAGSSLNAFCIAAMNEKIEREDLDDQSLGLKK